MGTVIGTALVLVVLVVIAFPFLSRQGETTRRNADLDRIRSERLRIYRLIGDLEADRASGEMSADDFTAALNEHRMTAARLMRDEEALGADPQDGQLLEEEIEAARAARRRSLEGGDRV